MNSQRTYILVMLVSLLLIIAMGSGSQNAVLARSPHQNVVSTHVSPTHVSPTHVILTHVRPTQSSEAATSDATDMVRNSRGMAAKIWRSKQKNMNKAKIE